MIVDPPTEVRVDCGLPSGTFTVVSTWRHRDPKYVGVWLSQPPSDRVWPITKTTPELVLTWEVFATPPPEKVCCGDPGDCEGCP